MVKKTTHAHASLLVFDYYAISILCILDMCKTQVNNYVKAQAGNRNTKHKSPFCEKNDSMLQMGS